MLNFLDGRPQPDNWLVLSAARRRSNRIAAPTASSQPTPPEHVDFIRTWGDCFETDTHFFVHGSYEPERPLAEQHWQTYALAFAPQTVSPAPHVSGKTAIVGHTSQKTARFSTSAISSASTPIAGAAAG